MRKLWYKEDGVLTIEASIVFPVMFFVIFFLIYMGNAFYMKAQISSMVDMAAIEGAAYCADPLLSQIEEKKIVPSKNNDIQPYRYLFSMKTVEKKVKNSVEQQLENMGTGFFSGMNPRDTKVDVAFNNRFLYYTLTVSVNYKIKVPIRFIGSKEHIILNLDAKSVAPVTDTADFINTVDMVVDYYESSQLSEKVSKKLDSVKEFFKYDKK